MGHSIGPTLHFPHQQQAAAFGGLGHHQPEAPQPEGPTHLQPQQQPPLAGLQFQLFEHGWG